MSQTESAAEHLRNAQFQCQLLEDLLDHKDLQALARDVRGIHERVDKALEAIAKETLTASESLGVIQRQAFE